MGRNRKGAGAPKGNRNAWLHGLTRKQMTLIRLRESNRLRALQRQVLVAEVERREAALVARGINPHDLYTD